MSLTSPARSPRALAAVLAGGLSLAACSGGGGGDATSSGVFVDSPVAGLGYSGGSQIGVTDAQGRYSVTPGTTMVFFLGDIVLGVAPYAREHTPISITGAADETDPEATNIVRLLLALDGDADPSNGISISQAVRDAAVGLTLNFDQGSSAFESSGAVQTLIGVSGASGLVSDATAQQHLVASLLGSRAGIYGGQYAGDDDGPFVAFIDRRGQLVGGAFSNEDQELLGFTGSANLGGTAVFGNTTTGSDFSGPVGGGLLSGTWSNPFFETSGTYEGDQDETLVPILDPALTAAYVGTWTGTATVEESATFSAIVAADGHVDFTLNDGTIVRAALKSASAGSATMVGATEFGTVLHATLTPGGSLSGTLQNALLGEAGTISGTKT